MRILDRYISSTVFSGILVVLMAIVSLDSIASLLDGRRDLENDYTFIECVRFVIFTLPGTIYQYLPFASLVGCLIGLGTLANNSELVVMRAAGVSVLRIVWAVMKPAIVFMLVGLILGEYIAPYTAQIAQSRRAILQQGGDAVIKSAYGVWNRDGDEYMHFNAVEPNGILYGVTRFRFSKDRRMLESSFAKRATYQTNYWLAEDIVSTQFDGDQTKVVNEKTREWITGLSPNLLRIVALEPENLSITGLRRYAQYLSEQGLNNGEYRLAYWKKLLQPLATTSLVLIAISFIFGPLRSVTMGYRIFSGVMVGIVFRTTQELLGPASLVFGFEPILATVIPIGICMLIGLGLLKRAG